LIIDNKIQKNQFSLFYRNWLWSGSIFKKLLQRETQTKIIESNLSQGVHYVEFWADRMPLLHKVRLNLKYTETKAEIRANNLIKNYASLIKFTAKEFAVDSVMVGAVVYQEQATNVNFIDTLTDYIVGTLYNIEDVDNPVIPHASPDANDFGRGVEKNYEKVRKLLDS